MDPADHVTAALNVAAQQVAVVHTAQWKDMAVSAVFIMLAAAVAYFTIRGLMRRDRDLTSRIDFDTLLIDPITGAMDPARCMLAGGFCVASLVLIYCAAKGTMSDGMYLIYCGAILVPAVAVVLKTKVSLPGLPPVEVPPPVVTTTTTTTVKPDDPK